MKLIIFSDIHGNLKAMDKMLYDTKDIKADMFIFLGDIIGYFYEADKIIDLLQNNNIICLKGNHDHQYIESLNNEELKELYIDKYGCSYNKKLSEEKINWLNNLDSKLEIKTNRGKILFVHGSIEDNLNGRIYPDTKINEDIYSKYYLVIMGHTHYKMLRKINNTYLINPGSLGQPRDKKGYGYLIIDTIKDEYLFKNIELDNNELINEVELLEVSSKKNKEYLIRKLKESK